MIGSILPNVCLLKQYLSQLPRTVLHWVMACTSALHPSSSVKRFLLDERGVCSHRLYGKLSNPQITPTIIVNQRNTLFNK